VTASAIVIPCRHVVVQVDVHVHRPASPVQVQHAAAETRVRVGDAPGFDCDHGSAPGVLHVDAGMAAVGARVAVVVPELGLGNEREDQPRHTGASRRFGASRGHEEHSGQESGEEREEDPSSCRPVASHMKVRSGSRAKGGTLADRYRG
jgi:hypothetical protein